VCSAALEKAGYLSGVITQNVDRLHQAAGTLRAVELHGTIHEVSCFGCGRAFSRSRWQTSLAQFNARWYLEYSDVYADVRAVPPTVPVSGSCRFGLASFRARVVSGSCHDGVP
jgi:NAD-dependent deacetylase sirtuin 4